MQLKGKQRYASDSKLPQLKVVHTTIIKSNTYDNNKDVCNFLCTSLNVQGGPKNWHTLFCTP